MVRVNQHFVVVLSSVSFTCLKWQVRGQVYVMSAPRRGAMSAAWGHGSLVRVPRPLSSLSHSVHSERLSFVCESGDGTREARVSDFYGGWRRGKTASRRAAFAPRLRARPPFFFDG